MWKIQWKFYKENFRKINKILLVSGKPPRKIWFFIAIIYFEFFWDSDGDFLGWIGRVFEKNFLRIFRKFSIKRSDKNRIYNYRAPRFSFWAPEILAMGTEILASGTEKYQFGHNFFSFQVTKINDLGTKIHVSGTKKLSIQAPFFGDYGT